MAKLAISIKQFQQQAAKFTLRPRHCITQMVRTNKVTVAAWPDRRRSYRLYRNFGDKASEKC